MFRYHRAVIGYGRHNLWSRQRKILGSGCGGGIIAIPTDNVELVAPKARHSNYAAGNASEHEPEKGIAAAGAHGKTLLLLWLRWCWRKQVGSYSVIGVNSMILVAMPN